MVKTTNSKIDTKGGKSAKVSLSKASRENDQEINTPIILSIINQEIKTLINNSAPQLSDEKASDSEMNCDD